MARKTKNPIDTSRLLQKSSGTLAQIAAKTNSLTLLANIVRQTCPDLPEEVWHIANFKQKSVVIEVVSAIWSQRLQFERMKISKELSQETNGELTQIEIKVSPYRNKKSSVIKAPKEKTQFISQNTAKQLNEVAKNAPDSLKKKLQSLAELANKKANQ